MKREPNRSGLTTKNVVDVIFVIFRDHVGRDNAISKNKLYKKVFSKTFNNSLEDFMRYEFLRRALHYCRLRTNCFIVSEWKGNDYFFYVLKNKEEMEHFQHKCREAIKGLEYVSKRASGKCSE